jgi:hypothetical protein
MPTDVAVTKGVTTLICSMDGVVAALETGGEPQSISGNLEPGSIVEVKDRKGNVITTIWQDQKGDITVPVIFYGATLPTFGSTLTLAVLPVPFAGTWIVAGLSWKGDNANAHSFDVKLRKWKYVTT